MTMDSNDWMDVFTVIDGAGQKPDFWLKIGRMFPHKNGDGGFNIVLNAHPIGSKLVIKPRRKREESEPQLDDDE